MARTTPWTSVLGDDGDEAAEGGYLHCREGSPLAMYEDQERYFEGLIEYVLE
jgi:hypothetical protein